MYFDIFTNGVLNGDRTEFKNVKTQSKLCNRQIMCW